MFASGLIEADPNPGAALYAALEPTLDGAGFTFLKSLVIAGRTHSLWQAPDTNSHGETWVLDITYYATGVADGMNGTNGYVWLSVYESFDTGSDQALGGAMHPWTATPPAADGTVLGALAAELEDVAFNSPYWEIDQGYYYYGIRVTSQPFGYWFTATHDRVILMTSLDQRRMGYAGLFTPHPVWAATAGANLFPLCAGRVTVMGLSEDDYLFVTRMNGWSEVNEQFYGMPWLEVNFRTLNAIPDEREFYKAGGGAKLGAIAVVGGNGGLVGELIGLRAVSSFMDANIGEFGVSVSRGDVANATDVNLPSGTTPNQQWVLSAPAQWNNGMALAMKVE